MNMQLKAQLGVVLIFALGCLAGGLGASVFFAHRTTVFFQRGSAAYVDILDRRLSRKLKLDADQKEKVHGYLVENLEKRKDLQKQIHPQVRMVNEQTVEEITAILRPEQAAIFHENLLNIRQNLGAPSQPAKSETTTNAVPFPAPAN